MRFRSRPKCFVTTVRDRAVRDISAAFTLARNASSPNRAGITLDSVGMMRVLVANIPLPHNRFLRDLNGALERHCEVVHASDEFWDMNGEYDVVHLHFPEYLTFEIEQAYRTTLTRALIEATAERLDYWSQRASIAITRHVLLPHAARNDPLWEAMYELVYSYCDGVAHFGQASIAEFEERYSGTVFRRGRNPQHAVIPHQNYASLPFSITRSQARRHFGLLDDTRVMLVFGGVRSREERDFVLDTFGGLTGRNVLLASSWKEIPANVSWIRLQGWIRQLRRFRYRLDPSYRFNYSFVPEDEAQRYLAAADIMFIPRKHVLNSGNVALGMTFGLVVVGPSSWNVGELLSSTGNPVFDSDDPNAAVAAVEEGFRLADDGVVGAENRRKALEEWSPEKCAQKYFDLFTALDGERSRAPAIT